MKFEINIIPKEKQEKVVLNVHQMTDELSQWINKIATINQDETVSNPNDETCSIKYLMGKQDERFYKINLSEIYYIESVDRRIYIYTDNNQYEISDKLYVLEQKLAGDSFIRVSKSMILSLDKIDSFAPLFSGNMEAILINKEKVIISRRYVNMLKKVLGMGGIDD